MTERPMHCGQELIGIQRLDKKSGRASRHYCSRSGGVFVSGDKDHTSLGRPRAQVRQQFHPGHCFHPDIQNDELYGICFQVFEKRFCFAKGMHAKSFKFEQSTDGSPHRPIVINNTDHLPLGNFGPVPLYFAHSYLAHVLGE